MKKTDQRITTRNVNYRRGGGVSISRNKYEIVRKAILASVPRGGRGVAFADLPGLVREKIPPAERAGLGSIPWYTVTVKLDLEARGLIERIPGAAPQRLRRVSRK